MGQQLFIETGLWMRGVEVVRRCRRGRHCGLVVLAVCCLSAGCGVPSPSELEELPSGPPNRLWWIEPTPGDVLVGSILLEAGVEVDEPVESVTFLVDGSSWETVREPPWTSEWSDADPGWHELEFVVKGSKSRYESPPIEVDLQTGYPLLLAAPLPGRWQTQGRDDSLTVRSCPGSPPLHTAYRWIAGGTSWQGRSFPLSLLAPGPHRVSAETLTDGMTFQGSRDIEIVQLSPAKSPSELWASLLAALRTRDARGLEDRLAEDMIFLPCQDGFKIFATETSLSRVEFVGRMERLWNDHPGALRWSGRIETVQKWSTTNGTTAWLVVDTFELASERPLACDSEGPQGDPPSKIGLRLMARDRGGTWEVLQWSERSTSSAG